MSTLEALTVAAATFAATVVLTRPLIAWLQVRQFGKAIRADGPNHQAKAGTPTMGGLGMLAAIGLAGAYLLFRMAGAPGLAGAGGALLAAKGSVALPVAAMAGFAVLGLADDVAGLAGRQAGREAGVGLTARRMFTLQATLALVIGMLVASGPARPGDLLGSTALGWLGWLTVSVLAVLGTANGVNMSDGLDGLAAGLAAVAFGAMALISVLAPMGSPDARVLAWPPAAVIALAIAGACAGFLIFNRHPARAFMGNVASMALGAGLATVALVSGLWPLLPIVGAVFVVEVVSVIVQVAYFKHSGGQRVFRMAPIHHHFELGGWGEVQIVRRFWLAGLLAALAGIAVANV